jgi:hypothetical protein
MNFGEHDLHNITHNVGIQHKAKFWSHNPNSFIEHDNTRVFIQALHGAEPLDHLHTYVHQKIIIRTLREASTLTQKPAEEAKLRVHDFPPRSGLSQLRKDTN